MGGEEKGRGGRGKGKGGVKGREGKGKKEGGEGTPRKNLTNPALVSRTFQN